MFAYEQIYVQYALDIYYLLAEITRLQKSKCLFMNTVFCKFYLQKIGEKSLSMNLFIRM